MNPLRKVQKIFSSDFLPLIPEGKSLKISVPLKSPLGDLGVKRLFGVDSIMNTTLKNLLDNPPKIHDWSDGVLSSSGLHNEIFEFMDNNINQQSCTVETGMGISTAFFCMQGL